jgi:hypothetical protein
MHPKQTESGKFGAWERSIGEVVSALYTIRDRVAGLFKSAEQVLIGGLLAAYGDSVWAERVKKRKGTAAVKQLSLLRRKTGAACQPAMRKYSASKIEPIPSRGGGECRRLPLCFKS